MGISPIDMLEKKGISREEYDKLSFEEKFSLIDVETLIEMSDKLIEKIKGSKKWIPELYLMLYQIYLN